jgi:microcystin-dependent protein
MGQPYVGEIRMFGGNFAPAGWMFCEGQLLPISENETLFNLIGTTYGGDGQETFALPDLRGRLPLHPGTNQGTTFILAETGGAEEITLSTNQIAAHSHSWLASDAAASSLTPNGNLPGEATKRFYVAPSSVTPMAPTAMSATGGSQPHTNFQPYLCISFIISLYGVFPTQ